MHLAEGIVPAAQAATWGALALPIVAGGVRQLSRLRRQDRGSLPLIAMMGAAVFIISLLPIPVPISGTSSHMCGTPLAAILLGPWIAALLGVISLLFQALLFGHGGLTTLGANTISMAIVGSFSAWFVYHGLRKARLPWFVAAGLAGVIGDAATYTVTAAQLAWACSSSAPFLLTWGKTLLLFSPTQGPLALLEGGMTAYILQAMYARRPDLFSIPGVIARFRTAPILPLLLGALLGGALLLPTHALAQQYSGMDEVVVEQTAAQHGRPAQPPLIPMEQGDLPLFLFAAGGLLAGFIIGRTSAIIFPSRKEGSQLTHAPTPADPTS